MKTCYVYILASGIHGTLYIGVTSDLVRRVYEHKQDMIKGFQRGSAKRETTKKMEQSLESRAYRKTQSAMDGFI